MNRRIRKKRAKSLFAVAARQMAAAVGYRKAAEWAAETQVAVGATARAMADRYAAKAMATMAQGLGMTRRSRRARKRHPNYTRTYLFPHA